MNVILNDNEYAVVIKFSVDMKTSGYKIPEPILSLHQTASYLQSASRHRRGKRQRQHCYCKFPNVHPT